jgi:hypothetical protein
MKPLAISLMDPNLQPAEARLENAPASARVQFDRLVEAAEKRRAETDSLYIQRSDLRSQIEDARGRYLSFVREKEHYGERWREQDEKRLAEEKARLDKLVAKHDAIKLREDDTTPTKAEIRRANFIAGFIPDFLEYLAKTSPRQSFVERRAELPGGDLQKAYSKATAQFDAIIDRLAKLENSKASADEAVAKMRADLAKMAEAGAPDVTPAMNYRARGFTKHKALGDVKWPEEPLFNGDLSGSISGELGVSFACWLWHDEIADRLEAQIRERVALDPDAMPTAERDALESKLRAELLDVQRVMVRIAEELGDPVPHVHPLAALQVELGEILPERFVERPLAIPDAAETIGHRLEGDDAEMKFTPLIARPGRVKAKK